MVYSVKKNFKNETSNLIFLWGYAAIVLFASIYSLFPGRGILDPNNLTKFEIYLGIIVFFLIIYTIFNYIRPLLTKKNTPEGIYAHDPEESGFFGLYKWSWISNKWKFILFSFVVITPIFLLFLIFKLIAKNTFVGATAFGVSGGASLFFSIEPATLGETLIISAIAMGGHNLSKKFSNDFKNIPVAILTMVASFLVAWIFLVLLHNYVYAGQEVQLANVAFFFFLVLLSIMITGSIIFGLVFHWVNNFVLALLTAYGADGTLLYLAIFYFVFVWGAIGIIKFTEKLIRLKKQGYRI